MVGGRELGEEANSWIRRTKFSQTVCYRFDSSKLASFPIIIQPEKNSGLKLRPIDTSFNKQALSSSQQKSPVRITSQIQLNTVTNKQGSKSPQPRLVLSDTFKEARFERKRFSTPHPRSKDRDEGFMRKLFRKDPHELKSTMAFAYIGPLWHLASVKGNEKPKSKREFACTKYFDHSGGRVNAVEAVDNWTIDMSKLFLGMRFAFGAHSRVYHGMYEDENVAVKIISAPDDDENGVLSIQLENQFCREVTLLSRLHHPNVIKFVAASRKTPIYCIITEYLSEGSLRAYLRKLEQKSLPLQKLIAIALDIARGMEYVHSQGVIHRDLKPENILIDQDFHMKIADFGIACEEAYCDSLADDPGTYRWMAPEMIKRKSYGRKVDVYSFGLILWEMVSGRIPYEDMNPIQAAFAVVNKNLRPAIPESCPLAMRALIERCWSLQSEKRPEFWQIVKVLEQFESSLASDGTLSIVQNTTCQDQKRGLLHCFQKLGPVNPSIQTIQKLKIRQPSS